MNLRIVIIEDEALIAEHLESSIMELLPDTEVLARIATVEEGIEFFQRKPDLDLIISDIQLSDGLSFDIFIGTQIDCPVIYCTAYEDYMLDAFKSNGIDYLLKPLDQKELAATLKKYEKMFERSKIPNSIHEEIKDLIIRRSSQSRSSILIRKGEFIIPVLFNDILLVHLDNGRTKIKTSELENFVINESLDALDQSLGPSHFRLNRQVIIHRDAIDKVANYLGRKLMVFPRFEHPEQLLVSKKTAPKFLEWLSNPSLNSDPS